LFFIYNSIIYKHFKLYHYFNLGFVLDNIICVIMDCIRRDQLSQSQQRLIENFVTGTIARSSASLCLVHRNTSTYYFHRLREIIVFKIEPEAEEVFGGKIEVDEC